MTTQLTAADAFISECLQFSNLMDKLADLRADHFGVSADAVDWGDVGSAKYVNEQLREALAHYGQSSFD
jgi:hypothetical protein